MLRAAPPSVRLHFMSKSAITVGIRVVSLKIDRFVGCRLVAVRSHNRPDNRVFPAIPRDKPYTTEALHSKLKCLTVACLEYTVI